jgi:hypothetical protein
MLCESAVDQKLDFDLTILSVIGHSDIFYDVAFSGLKMPCAAKCRFPIAFSELL